MEGQKTVSMQKRPLWLFSWVERGQVSLCRVKEGLAGSLPPLFLAQAGGGLEGQPLLLGCLGPGCHEAVVCTVGLIFLPPSLP